MSLTQRELELAKSAIAAKRRITPLAEIPAGMRTQEEHDLAKKYPRSTLEQAREIDATGPQMPSDPKLQDIGFVSGFERIVGQERGNYHLSGDHT
jgi:hypothetical protein